MTERALFDAALEIHDPAARSAYLDQACANQPELRARVEDLLRAHEGAGSFLNVPVTGPAPDRTTDFSYQPPAADDDEDGQVSLDFLKPSRSDGSIGRLGHYEILQVLGRGAFGIVFRAFDEKLHRQVAIKALSPQLAATSPPRKRFLREARSVAAIKHENIVQIYSVEEEPLPYLVMEFVQGQTLQQKLDGAGPLEVPEILHLGRQIAAGLAAAHAQGLIHRDIKPGNILLEQGAEQKVKITDFGLARAADDASMTRTGVIAGTPLYMAPEQALGQKLDARSDLFSLGSVLYQTATGRAAFRAPNTIAVLRRVVEETPRDMQEVIPELPPWLVAIVMKLLEKKPEDRYQTAKEVAEVLAKCQAELQIHGEVKSFAAPKAVAPIPAPTTESDDAAPGDRWKIRVVAWALTLLLLIGVPAAIRSLAPQLFRRAGVPTTSTPTENPSQQDPPVVPVAVGWQGWPADAPPPAIAPFDAARAKRHQDDWAAYLKVPVEYKNSLGMKFRLIPPGEFLMGTAKADLPGLKELTKNLNEQRQSWLVPTLETESPQHTVVLTQPFYLAETEVTVDSFDRLLSPQERRTDGEFLRQASYNLPAITNLAGAINVCNALNEREGLAHVVEYNDGSIFVQKKNGYRLPTEAEWEFACRSGTLTEFSCGSLTEGCESTGWVNGNGGVGIHAVAQLDSNALGLFDMHGNAAEVCLAPHDPENLSRYTADTVIDPLGLPYGKWTKSVGVITRGGSGQFEAIWARSSSRNQYYVGQKDYGLRLVLPIDAVRKSRASSGPAEVDSVAIPLSRTAERPIDYAAERKAAERLLSLKKGKAYLFKPDGSWLADLKEPLPSQDFYIHAVEIYRDLRDDELAVLVGAKNLRGLDLRECRELTAAGIAKLGPLPELRQLLLTQSTGVGDELLPWLRHSPRLQVLHLVDTAVSAKGWRDFPAFADLRRLSTSGHIDPVGLAKVAAGCPSLNDLTIFNGAITDISPIAGLKRLRRLQSGNCLLSQSAIDTLKKLPQLEELQLDGYHASDLRRITSLDAQLRRLHLRFQWKAPPDQDVSWEAARQLSQLEELTIDNLIPVDSAALRQLGQMACLKKVAIVNDPADQGSYRSFTSQDIARVRQARPEMYLEVLGRRYPALTSWPEGPNGELAEWSLPPNAPPPAVTPFSAEDARRLQTDWAKFLDRPIESENSLGMKFVLIPPGELVFSSAHLIRFPEAWEIGATEVTYGQFQEFSKATDYQTRTELRKDGRIFRAHGDNSTDPALSWKNPGYKINTSRPITYVVPEDIAAFCEWLGKKDGCTYRLPTETEWEFLARAGAQDHNLGYLRDAASPHDFEWFWETLPADDLWPQPVATKKPNPFGVFDLFGNVHEYCLRYPSESPFYLRGLAYNHARVMTDTEILSRNFVGSFGFSNTGFRLVRTTKATPDPPFQKPIFTPRHQPLAKHASVSRPTPIPGVRSWSVETTATQGSFASAIAVNPRGELIATVGEGFGKIILWNRDGRPQRILLGHEGHVTSLALSSDGRWLASVERISGNDGHDGPKLRVWNVETGAAVAVVSLETWEPRVEFSPNGEQLAVAASRSTWILMDMKSGRMSISNSGAECWAMTWSRDGRRLLGWHTDGKLRAWDAKSLEVLAETEAPRPSRIADCPDGRHFALLPRENAGIELRDRDTLEVVRIIGDGASDFAWLPDGKHLAVTNNRSPTLYDVDTGESVRKLDLDGGLVIAVSGNGKEIVTESDGKLQFCDAASGKRLREGKKTYAGGSWGVLSADGREVCVNTGNRALAFSADSGTLLRSFHIADDNYHPLPSPDGEQLALIQHYGLPKLEIVDALTGKDRRELVHPSRVHCADWSPDGKLIATGSGDRVRIWNAAEGKLEQELEGHTDVVCSVAWSPSGGRLASLSADKTLRSWEAAATANSQSPTKFTVKHVSAMLPAEVRFHAFPVCQIQWGDRDRTVWICSGNNILPFDSKTGELGRPEVFSNGNITASLASSPDGERMLIRENYGWTFLRGRDGKKRLLGQHLGDAVRWHPDGRRFLGSETAYAAVGYDVDSDRRLGKLIGSMNDDHWLCIGPTGHYRGSKGVEEFIRYVAQLDDGSQQTFTSAEFAERFEWKNDPEQAWLLGPPTVAKQK